jgi:hypothetical protein
MAVGVGAGGVVGTLTGGEFGMLLGGLVGEAMLHLQLVQPSVQIP